MTIIGAVEQEAIRIAQEYADANGFDRDDRRAVGLVLAGMAIASAADEAARKRILGDYILQFPLAGAAIFGWSDRLDVAVKSDPRS